MIPYSIHNISPNKVIASLVQQLTKHGPNHVVVLVRYQTSSQEKSKPLNPTTSPHYSSSSSLSSKTPSLRLVLIHYQSNRLNNIPIILLYPTQQSPPHRLLLRCFRLSQINLTQLVKVYLSGIQVLTRI